MARPVVGKPLAFYPIRVDEDVRKAIQALKKTHPTINAGLRLKLGIENARKTKPYRVEDASSILIEKVPANAPERLLDPNASMTINRRGAKLKIAVSRNVKRPIRSKGDRTR